MNDFDKQLHARIDDLPTEKQPQRDLWKGIELGLTSEAIVEEKAVSTRVSSNQWFALAASVCLASVLWLTVPQFFDTHDTESPGYALVESMSQQQQQQVTSLLASYQSVPAVTDNWQAQMNELDDAALAIKTALKNDPNNAALIRMLHQVYQQQIALIERVHAPKWQQI